MLCRDPGSRYGLTTEWHFSKQTKQKKNKHIWKEVGGIQRVQNALVKQYIQESRELAKDGLFGFLMFFGFLFVLDSINQTLSFAPSSTAVGLSWGGDAGKRSQQPLNCSQTLEEASQRSNHLNVSFFRQFYLNIGKVSHWKHLRIFSTNFSSKAAIRASAHAAVKKEKRLRHRKGKWLIPSTWLPTLLLWSQEPVPVHTAH